MGEFNKGLSVIDFLSTTSSSLLMLCKDLKQLEPNYNVLNQVKYELNKKREQINSN